jgi:hypothetical protein
LKEIDVKKLSSLLAATVLAAAFGNVYAATDNPCPDLRVLRDIGSTFTHAYQYPHGGKQPDLWVLTSEPFFFGDNTWQTVYTANMPGIDDPQTAVAKGQNDYNYSILKTTPHAHISGALISCEYSPEGGNYLVYADNQILSGKKRFM